jgi:hypothetical protein
MVPPIADRRAIASRIGTSARAREARGAIANRLRGPRARVHDARRRRAPLLRAGHDFRGRASGEGRAGRDVGARARAGGGRARVDREVGGVALCAKSARSAARRSEDRRARSPSAKNGYDEATFWSIYHRENWEAVKRRTDPQNLFRGLYEKFHFGR